MAKNNSGGSATVSSPAPVVGSAALQTPTDSPVPTKRRRGGGKRKRLLDGEGDYCIYEIAPVDSGLPKGSLVPLPMCPRFENSVKAIKWIRTDSGDLLANKQVMILRAMEILSMKVETKAVVTFETKPKRAVPMPEKAEAK